MPKIGPKRSRNTSKEVYVTTLVLNFWRVSEKWLFASWTVLFSVSRQERPYRICLKCALFDNQCVLKANISFFVVFIKSIFFIYFFE
jgi:hypothetical protein